MTGEWRIYDRRVAHYSHFIAGLVQVRRGKQQPSLAVRALAPPFCPQGDRCPSMRRLSAHLLAAIPSQRPRRASRQVAVSRPAKQHRTAELRESVQPGPVQGIGSSPLSGGQKPASRFQEGAPVATAPPPRPRAFFKPLNDTMWVIRSLGQI